VRNGYTRWRSSWRQAARRFEASLARPPKQRGMSLAPQIDTAHGARTAERRPTMQTTVDNEPGANPTMPDSQEESKSETINRIASSAHQAVDRIAQGADSALQSLHGNSQVWKATGDHSVERVQQYVREKPLMALGMAAAAGFLLSRLMR
jgi:ElaB/YqjD/DUF883 family membrane-anchored ribosome-binding protein